VEILLTAMQGVFAAACLFKFRFLRWEAYALLGLWLFQLFDPVIDPYLQSLPAVFGGTTLEGSKIIIREYTSVVFFGLTVFELWRYRKQFGLFRAFADVWRSYGPGGTDKSGPGGSNLATLEP
jgi:hypothetical protein